MGTPCSLTLRERRDPWPGAGMPEPMPSGRGAGPPNRKPEAAPRGPELGAGMPEGPDWPGWGAKPLPMGAPATGPDIEPLFWI